MRLRFKLLLVFAFSYAPLVWQAVTAMAGEQPVPSRLWTPAHGPDPEGVWRTVTQKDATTSSDCIGDLVTPLCTVDTEVACFVRVRGKLCSLATIFDDPPMPFVTGPVPGTYKQYRVASVRTASKEDLWPPPADPFPGVGVKVGDLIIDTFIVSCWEAKEGVMTGNDCDNPEPYPFTYALRRDDGRWYITDVNEVWY